MTTAVSDTAAEYISADTLVERVPGTNKSYWAQLRYTGRGPKFLKPSPRLVLYRWADVLEWLESSERTITGDAA